MTAKTPRRRFSATLPLESPENENTPPLASEEGLPLSSSSTPASEVLPVSPQAPSEAENRAPISGRFDESYRKLQEGVQRLRQTDLANIDDLVPLVQQTTQAYQDCKSRLDAVEKLIQGALKES